LETETFCETILSYADERGTISWLFAMAIANTHSLGFEFISLYKSPAEFPYGVDAGEFLVWLGY